MIGKLFTAGFYTKKLFRAQTKEHFVFLDRTFLILNFLDVLNICIFGICSSSRGFCKGFLKITTYLLEKVLSRILQQRVQDRTFFKDAYIAMGYKGSKRSGLV